MFSPKRFKNIFLTPGTKFNPTHVDDYLLGATYISLYIGTVEQYSYNYSINTLIRQTIFYYNCFTYFLMPILLIFLILLNKFDCGSCIIRLNCLTQPLEDLRKTILELCLTSIYRFVYYLKHTTIE